MAAYNAAKISLPRTAQTQYQAGPLVPAGQPLLPGDLVFYGTPGNVHHVGLYIGAGKMVHAPTFGQPIQVASYRWERGRLPCCVAASCRFSAVGSERA